MIRIGCSGWQYKHWKGDFYPADLPQDRWLEHYTHTFDTVELNNSFYRLPSPQAFSNWRDRTPPRFLFAVKASRFLTHMKKLNDPEEPLTRFFEAATELGPKLGPVLYQLPPRWPASPERLRQFVEVLPTRVRQVIEFREPSWYAPAIMEILESAGLSLCLHDMPGSTAPRVRLGPIGYVRFHGVTKYGGRYDVETLRSWSEWLRGEHEAGRDVFAYFNNDTGGHAPRDALRLAELLESSSQAARASRPSNWRPPASRKADSAASRRLAARSISAANSGRSLSGANKANRRRPISQA
jgi:uncharacterized protein YecE (DUF72 family)